MILAGIDTNIDYLKDLWKRNPDNTYEKLADSPYPLYKHSANLVDDDLLVVIGKPGYVGFYSIATNEWEFIANGPPVKGYHCTAQTVNAAGENIIFIFGGKDADGNESSVVYEYNVSTGVTTQRTEAMPQPIIRGSSC